MEQVLAGSVIVVATVEVGEVVTERRARQFLSEEINFVQEKDLRAGVGQLVTPRKIKIDLRLTF